MRVTDRYRNVLIEDEHDGNALKGMCIGSILSIAIWLVLAALWLVCGKMFVSQ